MSQNFFPYVSRFFEITYKDLKSKNLLSDFTRFFLKQRRSIVGREQHIAFIETAYILNNDFLCIFATPSTYEGDKVVDYDTLELIPNPKGDGYYRLYLRIIGFVPALKALRLEGQKLKRRDIEDILDICDIQIWSNDPSFQFQGMNYYLTRYHASLRPEKRKPKRWNKINGGALSKHLAGLLDDLPKFYGKMANFANQLLLV